MSKMLLKNNRGVIIVETSLIMPLILGIIFLVIYGLVYVMNVETVRCGMYSAIYTIPIGTMEEEAVYINDMEQEIEESLIWCEPQVIPLYMDGNVCCACSFDMNGRTMVYAKTEYSLCTSRLRRWQLYGNLAEK